MKINEQEHEQESLEKGCLKITQIEINQSMKINEQENEQEHEQERRYATSRVNTQKRAVYKVMQCCRVVSLNLTTTDY